MTPLLHANCHRTPRVRADRPGRVALRLLPMFVAALLLGAKAPNGTKIRPAAGQAPAASAEKTSGSDFEAFRMITDRNIFNPNRVSRARAAPEEEPVRIDNVSLVGTLLSDAGKLAFFDSPDRGYRKTLREGETLGGLTVKEVTPSGVQLVQQDQVLSLRVNEQLRRTPGSNWRVIQRERLRADVAQAADGSGMPVIPADASEVLRRLMEQRQKQLKQ